MIDHENRKRILIFLSFAFGIAWMTSLVIYLSGGLENSPTHEIAGVQISLALILLSTVFMFAPAIANILTRIITKEGKTALKLTPQFSQGRWGYYLAAWLLPGALTIVGTILFFTLFPEYFDSDLSMLMSQLSNMEGMVSANPWFIVIVQTLQALLISPILNAIPCFGEEFGWRGYLQPKLMPLGGRKAVLLTGVIWGVWHCPVILMGYNYGKAYFGAPYLGPIAMILFTISLSALFGWVTIKSENVWTAVIGHGAINGIASIGLLFVKGSPDSLLGPAPVGLVGGIGFALTALILFILPNTLQPTRITGLNNL